MSDTPRKIILANLMHNNPDRPGMIFSDGRMNDFVGASLGTSKSWKQKRWTDSVFEYYDDEWGNVWRRIKKGCAQGEVHNQALKEWKNLDNLRFPDFDDSARYTKASKTFAEADNKFRLANMPGWVFAISRYMRKMEIYFMDLIEYPEELSRLHTQVADILEQVIIRFAKAGADGIIFCEDLGIQNTLLMSPDMWRRYFRNHYERLTGKAHELGLKVFMHSCGYIWDLLDDLMDAGIDCFQFDQPTNYDMPALAQKLRDRKVAMWSPVDIQKVMPTGNKEYIEEEAVRMINLFRGGLICGNYGDISGIGVKKEWDMWAYKAILRASGIAS